MPKSLTTAEQQEAEDLIGKLGVTPVVLTETLRNVKLTSNLVTIIKANGLEAGCPREVGALIMMVASKYPAAALRHQPTLIQYIQQKKIKKNDQCTAAIKFLGTVQGGELDLAAFEVASGVGIEVTEEEIRAAVRQVLEDRRAEVCAAGASFNPNRLLQPVKALDKMVWADVQAMKAIIGEEVKKVLEAGANGCNPPSATPAKPNPKPAKKEAVVDAVDEEAWRSADPYAFLPKPEENSRPHVEVPFSDGHVERYANTQEKLKKHLEFTGGQVVTRFPPEPNGYLHIGHAKAMFVDFGMAEQYQGKCYLRFDDTNPEAESTEFIEHIKEIVTWMGWKYCAITHSSDYFDELYQFALQLIDQGDAYVCHQTSAEIKACREERGSSPWRDRPREESRKLFDDMRRGLIDEGKATLRLRMDPLNDNRNMDDLVAYRIKFVPHPHVGSKWCIYPSYDYTHCIVDALENITHSLCTLEFETRRASYYWLLDRIGLYFPLVWEYARLNIQHHVMSKRKLQKLVKGGHVAGWDDPRLPTLAGMRRRGFTPEALNLLCREVGITRNDNEIQMKKLLYHVRGHLDETSPRALAVLRPLRLEIVNLPETHMEEVQALDFPMRSEAGYTVPFTRVCYIEATDFREKDEKDYYGLAPGKAIMLRYAYPVRYVAHKKDEHGVVTEVSVEADLEYKHKKTKPPKGVLNWVAEPKPGQKPASAVARLYADNLFTSSSPAELDDFLQDLNPTSLEVESNMLISGRLEGAKPFDRFQLERLGYFSVDPDSQPGSLVFNRTCTLRDSYGKAL